MLLGEVEKDRNEINFDFYYTLKPMGILSIGFFFGQNYTQFI